MVIFLSIMPSPLGIQITYSGVKAFKDDILVDATRPARAQTIKYHKIPTARVRL